MRALILAVAALLAIGDVGVLASHDFDDSVDSATHTTAVPGVATTTTTTIPGTEFRARDGAYTLRIESSWPHRSDTPLQGFELWQVDKTTNVLASSMNVIVENLPTTLTLDQYLEANRVNLPKLLATAHVLGTTTVRGAYGQTLGLLDYEATIDGNHLHLVAVCSVKGKHAALLTFGSRFDDFVAARAAIDPYLLTLQAK